MFRRFPRRIEQRLLGLRGLGRLGRPGLLVPLRRFPVRLGQPVRQVRQVRPVRPGQQGRGAPRVLRDPPVRLVPPGPRARPVLQVRLVRWVRLVCLGLLVLPVSRVLLVRPVRMVRRVFRGWRVRFRLGR